MANLEGEDQRAANANVDRNSGGVEESDGVTWRSVVAEMAARFSAADVAHPDLSARRIAEEASGYRPADFVLNLHECLTQRMMVAVDTMTARRLNHEPLQYVVGSWGFRTLDVMVDHRVLIPRPETEEVAGWALEEVDGIVGRGSIGARRLRVADLGTGSGAIGLSMVAERPMTEVVLTDVDRDALAVARANTVGLGRPAERVVGILEGEWFDAFGPVGELAPFDAIVSNPPYVAEADELPPEVQDWEPRHALRSADDGFAHVEHIICHSSPWLSADSVLVIEMAPTQVDRAVELARGRFDEVEAKTDAFGRLRAIVARGHKTDRSRPFDPN